METEEILRELDTIFRNILKNENIALTPATTAKDVEGWDSLTNMRLITAIEKHYNIRFGLREILKFKHVGDLCASIQAKKK
mgnify:FL=1